MIKPIMTAISAICLAAAVPGAANGQAVGGSAAGGSIAGAPSPSGTGTIGSGGSSGIGSSGGLGSSGISPNPIAPAQGTGTLGTGGASIEQRATEGSTSINSINVDSIARSGNIGAATEFGGTGSGTDNLRPAGSTTIPVGTPGAGPNRAYEIPRPRIGVDLTGIRSALSEGPSATPKPNGE